MKTTLVSIESLRKIIGEKIEEAYYVGSEDGESAGDTISPYRIRDELIEKVEEFYRQQILALLKELEGELIGKDDLIIDEDLPNRWRRNELYKGLNEFRQEQRAILEKLREEMV